MVLLRVALLALLLLAKAIAQWANPDLVRFSAPVDTGLTVLAAVLAVIPYNPVVDLPYVNPLT